MSMKRITTIFAMCLFVVSFAQGASAQQTPAYFSALDTINDVNRSNPRQSARQERVKEIISDRILDSRNKVVGEVKDVILDRNGAILQLDVEFDRLRLSTDRMIINARQFGVRPVSNGYKLNYTDDQIVEIVPSILANIETASGPGAQDSFSVRKMLGRKVKNRDGKTVGKVSDILFDNLGGRADYLVVAVTASGARGEKVAIPYSRPSYTSSAAILDNAFAEAMIDYAKDQR